MNEQQYIPHTNEGIPFQTVEVNGMPMRYLEFGNKEGIPVVLLHGWLGSNAQAEVGLARSLTGTFNLQTASQGFRQLNWTSAKYDEATPRNSGNPIPYYVDEDFDIVDEIVDLKGKYHVIIPALPGTDYTPAIPNPSLDHIADQLLDFMHALQLEQSVIFGSSMGGILAVLMAEKSPELAKLLCLQGIPAGREHMNKRMYRMGHLLSSKVFSPVLGIKAIYQKLFEIMMIGGQDFQSVSVQLQQETLQRITRADWNTIRATLHDIGKDLTPQMQRITCPVVLVDGKDADLVTTAEMQKIAKKFPNLLFTREIGGGVEGRQGHLITETYYESIAITINAAVEAIKTL